MQTDKATRAKVPLGNANVVWFTRSDDRKHGAAGKGTVTTRVRGGLDAAEQWRVVAGLVREGRPERHPGRRGGRRVIGAWSAWSTRGDRRRARAASLGEAGELEPAGDNREIENATAADGLDCESPGGTHIDAHAMSNGELHSLSADDANM